MGLETQQGFFDQSRVRGRIRNSNREQLLNPKHVYASSPAALTTTQIFSARQIQWLCI